MKLTCVKCGLVWAVSSKHDKIGPYVCPRCAHRKERYDKDDERRDGCQDEYSVQQVLSEVYHRRLPVGAILLL